MEQKSKEERFAELRIVYWTGRYRSKNSTVPIGFIIFEEKKTGG